MWLDYFGNRLNFQTPKLCFDQKSKVLLNSSIPTFDTLHFQITAMAGVDLLSAAEKALCVQVRATPQEYLTAKDAMVQT